MDENMLRQSLEKYRLPYHWLRDPFHRDSLPYLGYIAIVLDELPAPPALILDAGCGDGFFSSQLINRGYEVVGLDFLDISIRYACELVKKGSFQQGDLRKDLSGLQPDGRAFDAVVLMEVYEHIPPADCPAVLHNLYQVIRPGGQLVISVPTHQLPKSQLHYRHFSENEFRQELEAAGFDLNRIIYQHQLGALAGILTSHRMERFLNNGWIQPFILKRLRRWIYMKYLNRLSSDRNCGRLIGIATKPGRA